MDATPPMEFIRCTSRGSLP